MSPSPLKTPGPGPESGSDAGSEQASCVGSDRHQSSTGTTAAPIESSNVDIGS
ncbi:atrophin, partial [Fusarium globosum]